MKSSVTLLVLFFTSFIMFSQENDSLKIDTDSSKNSIQPEGPYIFVPDMPEYINGGTQGLYEFIRTNIRVSKKAKKKKITGEGFYRFVVDTNGLVSTVEIKRGVPTCPECDEEAIRVIKMLVFTPGSHNGKKVQVWYNLPINFILRD